MIFINKKEAITASFELYFSVGMTRLELATTGPPDQHSKPTELHPVSFKQCKISYFPPY